MDALLVELRAALRRSGWGSRSCGLDLADELGVSPGPELAARTPGPCSATTSLPPYGYGRCPPPRQLPSPPTGFVGRAEQVRRLVSAFGWRAGAPAASLVTGTTGVGKTTLAVHVAHTASEAFQDGRLYVDLRGFHATRAPLSPQEVLGRFLIALDVPADRVPATVEERAALFRSGLAERRLLMVLDNARDIAQIRDLLPGAGPARVIVTVAASSGRSPRLAWSR